MSEIIKILTRPSQLALKQVEEFVSYFPELNYEILEIASFGDKHKEISLFSDIATDFFTREIDQALLNNEGDIAVHSAKDLPFPLPAGLQIIALLQANDKTDALVSKNDLKLNQLSAGARIGTSSLNRKKQIKKLRQDIEIIEIRGNIEERLNLLDQGLIDSLIVATCALNRVDLKSRISEILPIETHPLQGNLAIVAREDKSDLKILFNKVDIRKKYGKVFLIGAGVGDKELLTIKGDKILKKADIIFYDNLIDQTMLTKYNGLSIYVGKRKGDHSYKQDKINEKIYQAALLGKLVVRLKSGDPFIFGRGGEELMYLRERLIDVEVIPGITSMQVAASSSQIPLTMRGYSSRISVLTGHKVNQFEENNETIVYYMGATHLRQISKKLIQKGKSPQLPVALIKNAGMIDEKIVISTLKNIEGINIESPVLIIIGEVVTLCDKKPNILFTGLDPLHCNLSDKIFHYPLIEVSPVKFEIENLAQYNAFVFTSKIAVRIFCTHYKLLKQQKIIAIGPYTKSEIESFGYQVKIIPDIADSDHLSELIKSLACKSILYPCSQVSNNKLHKKSNIKPLVIYEIKPKKQLQINLNEYSGIVFSSASTVDAFFNLYKGIPKNTIIYIYGQHTLKSLIKRGYEKNVQTIQISSN